MMRAAAERASSEATVSDADRISLGRESRCAPAEVLAVEIDVTVSGHDTRTALERGSRETCVRSTGHRPIRALDTVEVDGEVIDAERLAVRLESGPSQLGGPSPREARALCRLRTKPESCRP